MQSDTLTGSAQADWISGRAGNGEKNKLEGRKGDDTLMGSGGNDTLDGGAGDDTLYGNNGKDDLRGGEGADLLFGGCGNDKIDGGGGVDTVSHDTSGEPAWELALGMDQLSVLVNMMSDASVGQFGNNAGNTGFSGEHWHGGGWQGHGPSGSWRGDIGVTVDLAAGTAKQGRSTDQLFSIENVVGSNRNDSITGDGNANKLEGAAGKDTLKGGAGVDTLLGGDGVDVLFGQTGNDTLTGGTGADHFRFAPGAGQDIITDFNAGAGQDDVIDFESGIFADFNAVLAAATDTADGVRLSFGTGNSTLLKGETNADDFKYTWYTI